MTHRQIVSIRCHSLIDACACMIVCDNLSMVLDL